MVPVAGKRSIPKEPWQPPVAVDDCATTGSGILLSGICVFPVNHPAPVAFYRVKLANGGVHMGRDTIPVIAVFSTISWVAWVLFSSIRRYKVAQLQADIQSRLLQRFDSPNALLGYAQSEAGSQFIKSMEIDRSTPYNQILKGVQAGIVFIFFGAGLLRLHAWNIGDEGPLVFGTLALALGLGFGVAAAVSYFLSRTFGLLSR
jgi:hypothetical protein